MRGRREVRSTVASRPPRRPCIGGVYARCSRNPSRHSSGLPANPSLPSHGRERTAAASVQEVTLMTSFDDYKGIEPYASELFGIYQPLLGWRSQIIAKRYDRVRSSLYDKLASRTLVASRAPVRVTSRDAAATALHANAALSFEVTKLAPLDLDRSSEPHVATAIDTGIARMILGEIGNKPPKDWTAIVTEAHVSELLKTFAGIVRDPAELEKHSELS